MRNVFFAALLYVLSLSGQVRAENIVFQTVIYVMKRKICWWSGWILC